MRGYCRRLRIWETNYGRNAGWLVERRGEIIATLTDPRFEDTFWDSYHLEVVTIDTDLRHRMQSEEFWMASESEGLTYRSQEFGELVEGAFPAQSPFPEPGRITMRRLYLPIREPLPWDLLVLWWRRRTQKHVIPPSPDPTT